MNFLKPYLDKLNDDQKVAALLAALAIFASVPLSLFWGESFLHYFIKFVVAILEMFIPGYVIYKLFLKDFQVTDNRVMDILLISIMISIATVQTLAFVSEYISVFGFNEDQDERIQREQYKSLIVVALVIGGAFGAKYLMEKNKNKQQ